MTTTETATPAAEPRKSFFGEKGVFWTLVLPVLLTIWLYPPFARHWQDLPKEKEFKSRLVISVTDAITDALSTGRVVASDLLPETRQLGREFRLIGNTRKFLHDARQGVARAHKKLVSRAERELLPLSSPDELSTYEIKVILRRAAGRIDSVLTSLTVAETRDRALVRDLRNARGALRSLISSFPERLVAAQVEESARYTPGREALTKTTAQVQATLKTYYGPDVYASAQPAFAGTFAYLRLSSGLGEEARRKEIDTLRSILGATAVSWQLLDQEPHGDGFLLVFEKVRGLLWAEMSALVETLVEEDTTVYTVGTCDVVLDLIPLLQRDSLNTLPTWACGRSR